MMGIFYKTVFDISVFYAFASFFFGYTIGYETNPLSYGVFLLAALVLAFSEKFKYNGKVVAIIAAVIPGINLLIETTTVGRIEVLLLWVYFFFMVKQETYIIYYYHFIDKFKLFVFALIFPAILVGFNPKAGVTAANVAIPYLLIYLTAGVMTLQAARQRAAAESRKQFEKFQILQTVLFFAVCILLTVSKVLQTLITEVIVPTVRRGALFLIDTAFKFIAEVFKLGPDDADISFDMKGFQEALSQEEPAEKFVEGNAWQEMIASLTEPVENKDMTQAFIYIGIFVAVIVLIALVGKAAKHSRVVALDVEREDLPEEEEPKKKTKRSFFTDPEKTVRQQYREFMKKAESMEHELVKSDTTEQIKEKYNIRAASNSEAAEQLTEVYRNIRYGEKTATKVDATTMKNLIKKI